ncbi:hypothetical protein CGLO_06488 [Colletotrichum gloeosporioides Cg-14]|uniref:RING-type domain-containing protein n=1 Tax=Colletotrichum gloeosporioides (strain Cg-14) TaxID=1237896 RepID=T0LZ07_COLGC|nr:hypothetical protein CGLO_06488 [Colletotrichum gloeosporioides Cg-14]
MGLGSSRPMKGEADADRPQSKDLEPNSRQQSKRHERPRSQTQPQLVSPSPASPDLSSAVEPLPPPDHPPPPLQPSPVPPGRLGKNGLFGQVAHLRSYVADIQYTRTLRRSPALRRTHRVARPAEPRPQPPNLAQRPVLAEPTIGEHPPPRQDEISTVPETNGPVKASQPKPRSYRQMADIEANIKSDCAAQIFAVFPDICPEYFEKTATELLYDVSKIIEEILGASSYPKKARSKSLKRKRESPAEQDEVSKIRQLYDFANRPPETAQVYISISKKVLSQDFPRATIKSITKLLEEHNKCLMQTYLALDEITRNWKSGKTKAGFEFKKTRTPPNPELEPVNLDGTIRDSTTPDRTRALEELRAARQVCEAEQSRRNSARAKVLEEENNFKQAREAGTIAECGCCFDERPLNRMVHCDNPDAEHYFCIACARKCAETAIGLARFQLNCMSMDGCSHDFSHSQRAIFLDDKLQAALDRIEFEAALQAQGFENLSACPFRPYAADCPPIEEDKEFRCANPECEIVSCRLCKEETHVPRTCEEAAAENGISERRKIEEAMSEALIRKCNKCGTPFIKEEGCNKMTCTRPGCRNVQCYVCSKSCAYDHFDDAARGGKKGNCPLFEQTEVRHEKEVRQAEEEARQKVLAAKPKLDEELLKFNMSKHVTKGEKKTRSRAHVERGPQVVQRWHAGVDPVGEAMRLHLDPEAHAAEQRIQPPMAAQQADWNNRPGLHQAIAQNPLQAQPPEQPKPVRLARPAQPAQPAIQQVMALQHESNAVPGAQNLAAGGPQIAASYNPMVPRYPSKVPLPIQQPLLPEPIPPAAYQFQAGNNGNQSAQQRQPLAQHHVVWPHRDGYNTGRQVPNAAARAAPQAVNGLFGVPDAVANNWNQLNMPPFGGGLNPFELDIGFELGLMAQQPANIDHSYPLSLFGAEANNRPVPGGMNFGNNAYGNPVNYVAQQPRDASELGRTRDNPLELD